VGGLDLVEAGIGGRATEELAQALIQIENHRHLGESLQRALALQFKKLEGGK